MPTDGGRQHHARRHVFRMLKTPDRLVGDTCHDGNERDGVGQRRQDTRAVIAVCLPRVRRASGLGRGKPGQSQGHDVRKHVSAIGEQGQRVREQAARDLDDQYEDGQKERGAEAGSGMNVDVAMAMSVVVIVAGRGVAMLVQRDRDARCNAHQMGPSTVVSASSSRASAPPPCPRWSMPMFTSCAMCSSSRL